MTLFLSSFSSRAEEDHYLKLPIVHEEKDKENNLSKSLNEVETFLSFFLLHH